MRRLRFLCLALAALASVALPQQVAAQFGPVQNSVIVSTTAAVNASGQVGTAQTFLTHSIGTGFFTGSQPIKIISKGYLASMESSPGTFTITVGVGALTLTPVSAVTLTDGVENVPYSLECSVLSTTSGTPLARELVCEFAYETAGGAGAASTLSRFVRRTSGTLSATTQQAITATVTFSDTQKGTGLIAQGNQILIGN